MHTDVSVLRKPGRWMVLFIDRVIAFMVLAVIGLFVFNSGQADGVPARIQDTSRKRIEGQHRTEAIRLARSAGQACEQLLVAAVHSIKSSDGEDSLAGQAGLI